MEIASRTADIDGPFRYVEIEGPGDGPTFVCVHGLGANHINWLPVATRLARHGRVLVPDLVGFGRTPLGRRSATVPANRAYLGRFIDTVAGGPVVLLGNSMGGAISILHAAARPDAVVGMVLVCPASPRVSGARYDAIVTATFVAYMVPGIGERFVKERLRRIGPDGLVQETPKMCCVDPSRVDPEVVTQMIELARERATSMPWSTTAFLQAARSLIRTLAGRREFMARVAAVSCPTLLLQGRQDRLVAVGAAQAIARARPDWEFVVFENLGHVPHLEDPGATLAEIERWLEGPAALIPGARRAEASG